MKIVTMVAALNYDFDNIHKQNFKGNVLIVNQFKQNRKYKYNDFIDVVESKTRGIGKCRLIGLNNVKGDIIVLADDDEVFDEDYTEKIQEAYKNNPDADVIMFNVNRSGDDRREIFNIGKSEKLHYFNSLKFGAVNISFRLESIDKNNIKFDSNFGKKPFLFGEDSIFIYDCLKKGLNLQYVNIDIAEVNLSKSSWFVGYDKDFFIAKGAQFYRLSNRFATLLMLQFVIRKNKQFKNDIAIFSALKYMIEGRNIYKKYKSEQRGI